MYKMRKMNETMMKMNEQKQKEERAGGRFITLNDSKPKNRKHGRRKRENGEKTIQNKRQIGSFLRDLFQRNDVKRHWKKRKKRKSWNEIVKF